MFLTESRQDGRAICNLLMMIEQTLEDKKPLEPSDSFNASREVNESRMDHIRTSGLPR